MHHPMENLHPSLQMRLDQPLLGSPFNWAIACWEIRSPMSEKLCKLEKFELCFHLFVTGTRGARSQAEDPGRETCSRTETARESSRERRGERKTTSRDQRARGEEIREGRG